MAQNQRQPHEKTNPLFSQRTSPRSFKKESIEPAIVESIFDAARWAPSCFNQQPWLFVTSSNEAEFNTCLSLLNENNQRWAKNASVIGFIFAKKTFDHNGNENNKAKFDCGAAWMSLTLQANLHGYHTHGIGGIVYSDIHQTLNVDKQTYDLICGFALGKLDSADKLPDDLAEKEKTASPRNPLTDMWRNGF